VTVNKIKDARTNYDSGNSLQYDETRPSYYNTIQNRIKSTVAKIASGKYMHSFNFDNEIPAFITIVPDSKHFSKKGIADNFSEPITKFLLNNYEERHDEKLQVFETFGSPAIFFFDKKVTVYSFSGYFVDSKHRNSHGGLEHSWAESFKIIWEENLRGTKLIENNNIALIGFNGNAIWGYPSNLTINNNAQAPFLAGFSFNVIVTKHKITRTVTKIQPITAFMGADSRKLFDSTLNLLRQAENSINKILDSYTSENFMSDKDKIDLSLLKERAKKYYSDLLKIINSVKIYKNQLNGA